MTRYPLMQPKSGHKDLCYTPNNNTRYLGHGLGSSEMRDVSNRLLRLPGEYITKMQKKEIHAYLINPNSCSTRSNTRPETRSSCRW